MMEQPRTPFETSPPASLESETALLGAILINPDLFLGIASFLRSEDFYLLRHQHIWEAMNRLNTRREAIDSVTVAEELESAHQLDAIGGRAYLAQLANSVATSLNAEFYARMVERTAVRRRLLVAADEMKALATDETIDLETVIGKSETSLFSVTERQLRRDFIPMEDAVSQYFDRIEYLIHNPDASYGVPSGFRDLDSLLGGFQKSDLLIFAGRPGMGKCVAEGTLIQTDEGLVPIESLKPTGVAGLPDEGGVFYPLEIGVQTLEGIRQTSHFYDSGVKPTLRIQTRAGYSLTGTLVHPVLTLDKCGERVWKRLSELRQGDYVAVQRHEPVWGETPLPYFNGERKPSYAVLERIAEFAPEVQPLLEPQFYWDEITRIEDAGMRHCYDLCVPDGHSFTSNGIVSHNTSFLLSAAVNAARMGQIIAIFSLEMGSDQLVQRMISMETGINSQNLRLGKLNQGEYNRFVEAAGRIARFPIYFDQTADLTPMLLRTKCRRLQHEHGLDMVVVDYLQLMTSGGTFQNNRVQEISYISRALKELARELNVPVFSASQLSRAVESRQDKRPQLSDLRESGSIEQDADVVMFLYRDVVYNQATEFPNQADVIVAKHRNGRTDTVSLYFDSSLTKFMDGAVRRVSLSE